VKLTAVGLSEIIRRVVNQRNNTLVDKLISTRKKMGKPNMGYAQIKNHQNKILEINYLWYYDE
jgi:hypothetical protein